MSFTGAEEAAIRQISPLISIVRFPHGSLGSKGNTTCVWQQSELNLVLPNLPEECKFIIIRRKQKKGGKSELKSTKFERRRIQRALELLSLTVDGVWKKTQDFHIEISQEKLKKWPEKGDLADMNPECHIVEEDKDDKDEEDGEKNEKEKDSVDKKMKERLFDTDGDDEGPAPLQNNVDIPETYEGALNSEIETNVGGANATMAENQAEEVVQRIKFGATYSDDKQTAIFDQPTVLPTKGFADMTKTPYAWARAFPTVFIPHYIEFNGKHEWIILNDVTGFPYTREKSLSINKWYEHQMWRSDGVPASHPTFSIVLYNHKIKSSLQKQGQYVINIANADPSVTVKDIKNAKGDDALKKQTEALFKRAHLHASNVPGTQSYWRATRFEFKAANFYNSYINKREVSLFYTDSLAEFHEHPLRYLLNK